MLGGIGLPELLIILVIILIVFGVGKLPKIAKSIGEGIKEFRKAQNEEVHEDKKAEKKENENDSTENL